jgi:hypothetical protein
LVRRLTFCNAIWNLTKCNPKQRRRSSGIVETQIHHIKLDLHLA